MYKNLPNSTFTLKFSKIADRALKNLTCFNIFSYDLISDFKMHYATLPIEVSESNITYLNKDIVLSEFKQKKYLNNLQINWDKFYNRNKDKFFKDRNWLESEFEELNIPSDYCITILEVGCGVGNTVIPLLKRQNKIFVHACDFSKNAINILKESLTRGNMLNCHAFVCDVAKEDVSNYVALNSIDYAILIFTLSAITISDMPKVISSLYKVLKPGGKILLRDYGMHDYAMIRFKSTNKISQNQYVRQDGTLSYFFTLDKLKELFPTESFTSEECVYVKKDFVYDREHETKITRIFVQAKFVKKLN